jgi:hypothetical protein
VLRVSIKHGFASDNDVVYRLFFAYTGTAPTSANLTTMATAVRAAWNTNVKALCSTAGGLTQVAIVDLTNTSAGSGMDATTVVGTRTGGALPGGVATLVNFSIARRYRGGKPRIYMPYGTQTDIQGSQTFTTTYQSAMQSALNAFVTAIIAAAPSGTTITSVVNVSYYEGFTVVTNPITGRSRNVSTARTTPLIDAVLSTAVNVKFASQRRRNLRK